MAVCGTIDPHLVKTLFYVFLFVLLTTDPRLANQGRVCRCLHCDGVCREDLFYRGSLRATVRHFFSGAPSEGQFDFFFFWGPLWGTVRHFFSWATLWATVRYFFFFWGPLQGTVRHFFFWGTLRATVRFFFLLRPTPRDSSTFFLGSTPRHSFTFFTGAHS